VLIDVRREDARCLADYAAISPAFEVRAAVSAPTLAIGEVRGALATRTVQPAYEKNYDRIPGNRPRDWPALFCVDRACFLGAYADGHRVSSAVVILDPNDAERLGADRHMALLWDLRVARDARRRGVEYALLTEVEVVARAADKVGIVAESQDINVAACETYAGAGYAITRIERDAYPELPGETRIVWTKAFEVVGPSPQ